MSEILSILFQSIPGVLYEPIAVGAVLGLVTAAIIYWKRRTPLYWLVGLSILFMIGWRLGIQIITGRYAAILIYPAIIATAYFCFQTEWLVKFIPKFPDKWRKIVPYLFVIGLGIASIAQTLHLNPYGDYIIRAAELMKKDANGRDVHILAIDHEVHRLSYYTGIPTSNILYSGLSEEDYIKSIGDRVHKGGSLPATACYIVLFESVKYPKGYYLQNISPGIKKHLHYLGEFYHNRKKRRVTRIYRYDYAAHFKLSFRPVSQSNSPAKSKAEIHLTFDKIYPATHQYYKNVIEHFRKHPSFKAPVLQDFPIGWFVWGTAGYLPNANAELGTVKTSEGKNVFRLKADNFISTYTNRMYPAKNWHIVMKVSGKKDTVFNFAAHCYNQTYGWRAFPYLPAARIQDDNSIYMYECTIPEGFYPTETKYIRPAIYLTKGELFVHSIELYSTEK